MEVGGLGLGSWILGKRFENAPQPARLYAYLESAIGILAPLTFCLIPLLAGVYWRAGGGAAMRFLVCAPLLVIPTFLMGGTLPVLLRVFRAGEADTGKPFARLYALNTIGGVLGAAVAGFWWIPAAGILRTAMLAGGMNLLAGALAWANSGGEDAPPAPADAPASGGPQVLLFIAFLSGATSMILEVAWTRRLVTPLAGSTYAFTVLLAAFLTGIAIGSRRFTRVARVYPVDREGLGWLQIATAIAGLISLIVWKLLPSVLFAFIPGVGGSFSGVILLQFACAFLILLLPAFLYGASFPWIAALYAPKEEGAAGRVGQIYALNTVGSIAGVLLAGFVLMPTIGSYGALAVAIGGSAVAGIVLTPPKRVLPPVAMVVVLSLAAWAGGLFTLSPVDQEGVMASYFHNDLYRSGLTLQDIAAMQDYLFMEDGLNATVAASRSERYLALKINGKVDASSRDMKTQILLAALPLAMHPAPRRVLVIGYGAGVTTRVAALWPGVERVDTLEIEPAVMHAAPLMKELNKESYRDPRVRVILDDARHFLFTTPDRYDVIISEPSNPWMAGIGNLFTVEYYRQVHDRLADGGAFVQWLQVYQLKAEDLGLVARTLRTSFPGMTVWRGEASDLLLAGGRDGSWPGAPLQAQYTSAFEKTDELKKLFHEELKVNEPVGIWAYFLLKSADLKRLTAVYEPFGEGERNTDDRPLLEYRAPLRLATEGDDSIVQAVSAAQAQGNPQEYPVQLGNTERLAIAETMLRIGEAEASRNIARPLLQALGDQPEIWDYAGDVNRVSNKPEVAESSYQKALQRGSHRALIGLALLAADANKPEAETMLKMALAPDDAPRNAEAMLALARRLVAKQEWNEAIAWQKKGIAASESNIAPLWAHLGEMYLRANDNAEAQKCFDKALALDPYTYAAHRILAETFFSHNKAQEAAVQYRHLLRYHPMGGPSLFNRAAEAFRLAGLGEEAAAAQERGIRLYPPKKPE